MISNKVKEGDFNSKTIFKLIQPTKPSQEVFFVAEKSNNTTKIISEENKVKDKVHLHFKQQFSKITEPKDLSSFLKNVPKITNIIQPNFSVGNISQTLISKQNTSPGEDCIPYQFYK